MSESAMKFQSSDWPRQRPEPEVERRTDIEDRLRYAVLNKLLTDCYRPITREQRRVLIKQASAEIAALEEAAE